MALQDQWSIKTAQDAAQDAAVADVPADEGAESLPENFAPNLITVALVNQAVLDLAKKYNDYPGIEQYIGQARTTLLDNMPLNKNMRMQLDIPIRKLVAGKSCDGPGVNNVILPKDMLTLIGNLKGGDSGYKEAEVEAVIPMLTNVATQGPAQSVAYMQKMERDEHFIRGKNSIETAKGRTTQVPLVQQQPQQRPASSKGNGPMLRRIKTAQEGGPLSSGRYESVSQLRDDLIAMGPSPETYEKFMSMVGPENEDSAKDALSSFFQGMASALCMLYDMLVEQGVANPIDAEIVEKLMAQHPELATRKHEEGEQGKDQAIMASTEGLFIPAVGADPVVKTAQRAYPAYFSHGAGENKYCPKIRKAVNCFICRNHCLDGLIVDDGEVLCAEAIWRQVVADKFSREYRDAKGNWVGGYINKRFEVHYDDGGHPALIVPGKRANPIHEDAWSLEKRLAEMRQSESKKRGYNAGSDAKDLYNFDQYELLGGADNRNFEKKKDPIAKMAVNVSDSMFKSAQGLSSFDTQLHPEDNGQGMDEAMVQNPTELMEPEEPTEPMEPDEDDIVTDDHEKWYQSGKLYFAGDEKGLAAKMEQDQFWPNVWFVSDHGNTHLITITASNEWSLKTAEDRNQAMEVADPAHQCGRRCSNPKCGNIMKAGPPGGTCPHCGSALAPYRDSDVAATTGNIGAPDLAAFMDADIRIANGVYRVEKNGVSAYGSTTKDALTKLAQIHMRNNGLAEDKPEDIGSTSEDLIGLRQQIEEEAPPVVNVSEEAETGQEAIPPPKIVKKTPGVSLNESSPVPQEVGGNGQSEFFEGVEDPNAAQTVEQAFAAGDQTPPNEGHVSAQELSRQLAMEGKQRKPEDQWALDEEAITAGAGPD